MVKKTYIMKILLTLFVLLFSSSVFSDDISEYQIEGISLGDSLLDHLSESEIIAEIEFNKPFYNYLNDDFGEVYLFHNLDTYDRLSFKVKPKDKHYTIYSIKGSISYDDKLDQCLAKQKEIEKEFSSMYKNSKKWKETLEFNWDPTGESITHNIHFDFDEGHSISVNCTKYKKSLKIENNWEDSLQVIIESKEVVDWFNNPIN